MLSSNTVELAVRYVRNRASNYSPLTKGGIQGGSWARRSRGPRPENHPPSPPFARGGRIRNLYRDSRLQLIQRYCAQLSPPARTFPRRRIRRASSSVARTTQAMDKAHTKMGKQARHAHAGHGREIPLERKRDCVHNVIYYCSKNRFMATASNPLAAPPGPHRPWPNASPPTPPIARVHRGVNEQGKCRVGRPTDEPVEQGDKLQRRGCADRCPQQKAGQSAYRRCSGRSSR